MSDRERKIYELVVKRFLAVLMPPFEYDETRIMAVIEGEIFTAKGKIVTAPGWTEAYGQFEDDDDSDDDLTMI